MADDIMEMINELEFYGGLHDLASRLAGIHDELLREADQRL
jgi:hypothetical protein